MGNDAYAYCETEGGLLERAAESMGHVEKTGVSHAAADLEAEDRLVGHYLVSCEAPVASSKCQPWHFRRQKNREYWARAQALSTIAQPSDLGIAPAEWARLSAHKLLLPGEVPEYETRIIQAAAARMLSQRVGEIAKALAANGSEYLQKGVARLREATADADAGMPSRARTHREVATEVVTHYLDCQKDEESSRLIPMIPQLQAEIGGWVRGKLFLVVARSSEHKTTILRTAAEHAAQWLHKQGIVGRAMGWTFEDASADLAARTIASKIPRLPYRDLSLGARPANKDPHELERIYGGVTAALKEPWADQLVWEDKGSPTLDEVCSRIRSEHARPKKEGGPLHLVTLEYGQLIEPDRQMDATSHAKRCASRLAALAKELDIPIVVALQIDKTATRESLEDGRRPPKTHDVMGGVAWWQACFGSLCLAALEGRQSRKLIVQVDKWKNGQKATIELWVDPARDRIE